MSVHAGRRVKAGRAFEVGKPLEVNLGLTTDPPHFGGHRYGVSYDVARRCLRRVRPTPSPAPPELPHHLHEDTCFGNWVVGFDVKRLNLRAMTDHYYPNQKNLAASRVCAEITPSCRRIEETTSRRWRRTLHAIV